MRFRNIFRAADHDGMECRGDNQQAKTCDLSWCTGSGAGDDLLAPSASSADSNTLFAPSASSADSNTTIPWLVFLLAGLAAALLCWLLFLLLQQREVRRLLQSLQSWCSPHSRSQNDQDSPCHMRRLGLAPYMEMLDGGFNRSSPNCGRDDCSLPWSDPVDSPRSSAQDFSASSVSRALLPGQPQDACDAFVQSKVIMCPQQHELKEAARQRPWKCDWHSQAGVSGLCPHGFGRHGDHAARRFRCAQCDFDLCEKCHKALKRHAGKRKPSKEVMDVMVAQPSSRQPSSRDVMASPSTESGRPGRRAQGATSSARPRGAVDLPTQRLRQDEGSEVSGSSSAVLPVFCSGVGSFAQSQPQHLTASVQTWFSDVSRLFEFQRQESDVVDLRQV